MKSIRVYSPIPRRALVAATVFLTATIGVLAAPLKVDISNSGRPLTEGLDPAFTDWATTQNWFTGGDTTSRTFDGVTVTFTRVGAGNGIHTVTFVEAVLSDPVEDPETVEASATVTGPGDVPSNFVRLAVE